MIRQGPRRLTEPRWRLNGEWDGAGLDGLQLGDGVALDPPQGAGRSYHPDAGGPGNSQLAGALGGGGSGGEHIVNEEDFASFDAVARGDFEGAANLLPPLFGGEGDLGFGKAHTQQGGEIDGEAASNGLFDAALGGSGDKLGLVEAARPHTQFVRRYGNHEQLRHVDVALKLQTGLGGEAAEGDGGGAYALIFEQVNQLPESSGIGPIVDGAFKGRGVARTSWAAGIAKGGVGSREEVSTDVAAGKLNGLNGFQAGCADRKA